MSRLMLLPFLEKPGLFQAPRRENSIDEVSLQFVPFRDTMLENKGGTRARDLSLKKPEFMMEKRNGGCNTGSS